MLNRSLSELLIICVLFAAVSLGAAEDVPPVRIVGSGAISRPLSLAVPILNERGIAVKVNSISGSTASMAAVGSGSADIALAIRPMTGEDRAPYPQRLFHETLIGYQALALAVPSDVWNSGARALSREQIRQIYEREVTNWKAFGGEDRPIKFFNPEQGIGIWEFFVTWLYGDIRKAPLGKDFESVNGGRETRDIVEFTSGSLALLSPVLVDRKGVYALAVLDAKGDPIEPTLPNIYNKSYPIERPLLLVTGEKPAGEVKKVIDFMCGPEGQALIKKSEFVPLESP
jgi:phosphate transport system substrate-binding protein